MWLREPALNCLGLIASSGKNNRPNLSPCTLDKLGIAQTLSQIGVDYRYRGGEGVRPGQLLKASLKMQNIQSLFHLTF